MQSTVRAARNIVYVLGVGTDVGKTHVTCALLSASRASARRVRAFKPIASGVSPDDPLGEDARAHGEASGIALAPMYRFERPVSPHLAARVEGQRIDVVALTSRIRSLAMEDPEVTWLVEGAGGVFSPLAEGDGNGRGAFTHAELVGQVGGRVLLVAPDRLGVLHDVRAAWLALRAALATMRPAAPIADTWSPVLALSAPSSPDGSAGTNAAELRRVFDLDVVACFPRAHYASEESHAAARAVLSAIERIDPWIAA